MTPPLRGNPRVSYGYGWRTHPTTGARNFHEGVDWAVGNGTPTFAALGGNVVQSGYNSAAGHYIIIQIDSTTRIRYNHLQARMVSSGQRVSAGQQVGTTNNTGNSSGPHLHFAVYRLSGGKWVSIEPLGWLRGGQAAGNGSTPARDAHGAAWVREVQTLANKLGAGLTVDGMDGPATQAWIRGFQERHGLTIDGIAGPATKAALEKAVKDGSKESNTPARDAHGADWVKEIQTKLVLLGYDIVVDSYDGPATQAAVRDVQKKGGLTQDGIAGPATNAYIDKLLGLQGDIKEDGSFGPETIKALQIELGLTGADVDGSFGPKTIRALQAAIGAPVDGSFGPTTIKHLQVLVGANVDGSFGLETVTKLQRFLNSGRTFEKTEIPGGTPTPPEPIPATPRKPVYPGAEEGWNVPYGQRDRDAGSVIDKFIIHHTASTADNTAYFKSLNDRSVAPTWYVMKDGTVKEMIDPAKRPSTTGAANTTSVSVETQNETGAPAWGIAQNSEEAIAQIVAWFHKTYHGKTLGGFRVDLPIDRVHVLGHREVIDPDSGRPFATSCPGPDMDLDWIVERARQIAYPPEPGPEPDPDPTLIEEIQRLSAELNDKVMQLEEC